MGFVGSPELIVMVVMTAALGVVAWPAGRICRRAGYSPFLGVLAIVPLVNVCLLWFMALADWPTTSGRV